MKIRFPEESSRRLFDFPTAALQLSPLSLSVDVNFVRRLLHFGDEFLSCCNPDHFVKDQHEVVIAEQDPTSDSWKTLQGNETFIGCTT